MNRFAAKYYWDEGRYPIANDFYLVSEDMEEYSSMLLDWASQGYKSELDLFVVRAVLWLLVKKNLRDANALFSCVRSKEADDREFLQLPLIHFCDFLLQTVTRKAAPVFNLLLEKYAPELDRDPSLDRLLREIGTIYFDIRPQGNLFSDMLKMFSGM